MKTCPDCGQALPIKDFYRNKSRRLVTQKLIIQETIGLLIIN